MFPYLNQYMNFDWEKLIPRGIDTKDKAIKALKRDIAFKYDKKSDTYNYKGNTIPAEKAINYVVDNSLTELKKILIEEGKL